VIPYSHSTETEARSISEAVVEGRSVSPIKSASTLNPGSVSLQLDPHSVYCAIHAVLCLSLSEDPPVAALCWLRFAEKCEAAKRRQAKRQPAKLWRAGSRPRKPQMAKPWRTRKPASISRASLASPEKGGRVATTVNISDGSSGRARRRPRLVGTAGCSRGFENGSGRGVETWCTRRRGPLQGCGARRGRPASQLGGYFTT